MRDGLSSDGVFAILEDDRGWFWMSSNQGIYRVRKQELNDVLDGKIPSVTSIAYNKQDGLLTVEANGGRQPAGVKARDGTLWFPTAKGIAVVDPETVMMNQFAPQVLIEDVFVDRQRVAPQDLRSAMDQGRSEILLEPHQNNLEIAYTGISFVNSAQVKFKYKLEGLDPDWHDVGTRRAAYYSYLPPGSIRSTSSPPTATESGTTLGRRSALRCFHPSTGRPGFSLPARPRFWRCSGRHTGPASTGCSMHSR